MSRDPLLIVQDDPVRLKEWTAPGSRWRTRNHEQLINDLINLADKVHNLTKEKNLVVRELLDTKAASEKQSKTLMWQKVWIGVLTAAVVAEFAAIGWFASVFLDRIMK